MDPRLFIAAALCLYAARRLLSWRQSIAADACWLDEVYGRDAKHVGTATLYAEMTTGGAAFVALLLILPELLVLVAGALS